MLSIGCSQFHYVSKHTIYVGEWIADIAKCGVMQPEDGRAAHERPVYPPIGLIDPDSVLLNAVTAARASAGFSTNDTPDAQEDNSGDSYGGLSEEDLQQLKIAFASGDTSGTGHIPANVDVLIGVLGALGIDASIADASAVLRELSAAEAGLGIVSTGETVSFRAFALTMAHLRQ